MKMWMVAVSLFKQTAPLGKLVYIGCQGFVVPLLDFHETWHACVYICIMKFQMKYVLDVIPAFFCLGCLADEGVGQAGDLASGRHAQLSFRISVAVSRSVSHSSNFVESHPSNVEMSWSKYVVRFVCHCLAHKVSVYFCIAMCRGSSMGLGVGCGWYVMTSCCNLLVSCGNSSVCPCGLVVGSN